ncbi:MAG: DNA starvation/stationary phase protection protein [Alphaproteobacteria bacterium]
MTKKSANGKNSNLDLVAALKIVLADTYVLAVKAHGYHWNVTGPEFVQLHEFFGKQYESLFVAADEIAERIRALDALAPPSMAQFLSHTTIAETGTKPLTAKAMLSDFSKAHEHAIASIDVALELSDDMDDTGSEDLMIKRRAEHEKTLWMLKSLLA